MAKRLNFGTPGRRLDQAHKQASLWWYLEVIVFSPIEPSSNFRSVDWKRGPTGGEFYWKEYDNKVEEEFEVE